MIFMIFDNYIYDTYDNTNDNTNDIYDNTNDIYDI
jgi:hypothetical protein